jgi:hypothetical protein
MHQPHVSSWCDVDEMWPDTLSHTCDRVSEAGHMLQGESGAIWRQGTRTGGVPRSLAAGMGFAPGEGSTAPQQCIRRSIT